MSDIRDLVPAEYIDIVKESMIDKIKQDPEDAWKYMKDNPIAILALSKIKSDLKEMIKISENEIELKNIGKFFEMYEDLYYRLFSVEHLIEKHGLALLADLIAEKWRRNNQEMVMASFNDIIMNNISILNLEAMKLGNSTNDKVTLGILADLNQRIFALRQHEADKVDKSWTLLGNHYKNMIDTVISYDDISNMEKLPEAWLAILHISTLSLEGSSAFQRKYSELLLVKLNSIFDELPENIKYDVAPYIIQLRQLQEKINNNQEN